MTSFRWRVLRGSEEVTTQACQRNLEGGCLSKWSCHLFCCPNRRGWPQLVAHVPNQSCRVHEGAHWESSCRLFDTIGTGPSTRSNGRAEDGSEWVSVGIAMRTKGFPSLHVYQLDCKAVHWGESWAWKYVGHSVMVSFFEPQMILATSFTLICSEAIRDERGASWLRQGWNTATAL